MNVETVNFLKGRALALWEDLIKKTDLFPEDTPESTVLVWENGELIATGSRKKNLLKYLAVSPEHQGEDLTATVLSHLRQDAFSSGYDHLFLYTKPKNRLQFGSLFFYPVAETKNVLLMENKPHGIRDFLDSLPVDDGETVGAAVMNCNPFTLGHRHLIETAAKQCDRLYVFVLSEENPPFTAKDRLELVKRGVSDLNNVTVYPSGPYLISSATFPTYFLKDRDIQDTVSCELDIEIFSKYYAPKFHITKRFVGEEPFSPMTAKYNAVLSENLPLHGMSLTEISRFRKNGTAVSATNVRKLMAEGKEEELKELVPAVTFEFLKENNYI